MIPTAKSSNISLFIRILIFFWIRLSHQTEPGNYSCVQNRTDVGVCFDRQRKSCCQALRGSECRFDMFEGSAAPLLNTSKVSYSVDAVNLLFCFHNILPSVEDAFGQLYGLHVDYDLEEKTEAAHERLEYIPMEYMFRNEAKQNWLSDIYFCAPFDQLGSKYSSNFIENGVVWMSIIPLPIEMFGQGQPYRLTATLKNVEPISFEMGKDTCPKSLLYTEDDNKDDILKEARNNNHKALDTTLYCLTSLLVLLLLIMGIFYKFRQNLEEFFQPSQTRIGQQHDSRDDFNLTSFSQSLNNVYED